MLESTLSVSRILTGLLPPMAVVSSVMRASYQMKSREGVTAGFPDLRAANTQAAATAWATQDSISHF